MNTKAKSAILLGVLLLSTMSTIGVISVSADTLIEEFWVSSDGTAVSSQALEFGKMYRIVASELFTLGPDHQADAMYYSAVPPTWNWAGYSSLSDGHSFLQINGFDIDWGPFSNGDTFHTYSIVALGSGAALMFQIIDWFDDDYSNNGCHLVVRIYEVPDDFYGATPGFWKNHLDAWVGYDPADGVCSVFSEAQPYVDCGDTLLDALSYHGGRGADGAARILLRAAVAAILNAEHPVINYPLATAEIIDLVNAALSIGNRDAMLSLATQLDDNNNAGTPWED